MARRATLGLLIASQLAGAALLAQESGPPPIVFVCQRGSAKSMIATQWFNRLAAERGLRVRALSRGVDPEAKIPDGVAAKLRKDGFDLTGLVPARLQEADLARASRVVAIGVTSPLLDGLHRPPERWDDIPPTSVDYDAARDALRARINSLLDSLAQPSERP